MINLYVGYDPREACVYHTFCQSVIENATVPVRFIPLHRGMLDNFDGQQDGTNAFIFSRYLIPQLQGYEGWAIFVDGDMHVNADINELWALRDKRRAVQVVPHDYQTKHKRKYIGTPIENDNVDYPRKNQSSVMLWNCGHPSNKILTRRYVQEAGGAILHRFQWLNDEEVGELPLEWNWLVGEYPERSGLKLYHHTLGSPGFSHYADCYSSDDWHQYYLNAVHMEGESALEMTNRAVWQRYPGRKAV